jgi:hypothetical protein
VLSIVPVNVFELTTEVVSEIPFHRMTALLPKFVPTTVIVVVFEPAGII